MEPLDLLQDHPDLKPFVLSNVRLTGTKIGAGAYGSVEEVVIPGAICAAKKIHDFFQDTSQVVQAEIRKTSAQFVKECQLMSTLRHPHIVQFLGVCFFPGSRLPALVMERLLTSLHDLLDPETDAPPSPDERKPFFPLRLKCSILHNVASGLAFLHERSPPIIHRDLSARNVLLNSGMVAKIADLGVARIVPLMRTAATMTKAPGASVYMPPEALEDKPGGNDEEQGKTSKYDVSIDIFSFGVISIFTLIQTFPCKLLAPNYREGSKHIARTELDRRQHYMTMIYRQLREQHPLLQVIEKCLDFPENRPNIGEVMCLLEQARDENIEEQMEMNKLELIRTLQMQKCLLQSRLKEITELEETLKSSERKEEIVRKLKTEPIAKEADLARAEETIRREQRSQQEAEARDKELAQAQQHIQEMKQWETTLVLDTDKELAQAQQQLKQKEEQLQSSKALVAAFQKSLQQKDSELDALREKLTLWCHDINLAPWGMVRGSATTDDEFAHFTPAYSNSVYSYRLKTKEWEELPSSPYCDTALATIDNKLTAVGGWAGSHFTKESVTLQQKQWVKEYPPMNISCSNSAVVSTSDGHCIITIGGLVGGNCWTTAVKLFHVSSRRWYELTDLPQPLTYPSATICGNQLHVIGSDDSGYSCSLRARLSSDTRVTTESMISWTSLPRLPVKYSTAASLCEQLVIVGGRQGTSPVNYIYQLIGKQWVKICSMSHGRSRCLVVNPSPNKLMIVGGVGSGGGAEYSIEEYFVV